MPWRSLVEHCHCFAYTLCGKALDGIYALHQCFFYYRHFIRFPAAKYKVDLPAFRKVTAYAEAKTRVFVCGEQQLNVFKAIMTGIAAGGP